MSMENQPSERDTLLVIDDTPANLSVLFDVLNQAGFSVLIAKNGERGLHRALYAMPDLILLDIMMPDLNGFEVCRQLKQNPKTRDIPVIFMSALHETVDKVEGFEAGAADYITKPFEHQEVLARVRAHLQVYKLQHELRLKEQELAEKNRILEEQNSSLVALANVLQEAKMAAEEANEVKSDLFAGMGHELRAPMNAIMGYSQILEQEARESAHPELANDLQRISKAGRHLLELINSLLDFSRIEAGKLEVLPEEVHLPALCEEVEATILPLAAARDNRFVLECPAQVPVIDTDALKLRQILINLLSNACKFTSQGTITLRIECITQDEEQQMFFYVQDTGIGIEKAQLPRIFQAFTQSSAAIGRKYGGTGLGLAITQRLVDLLHGDIKVESQAGQGSLFTVRIPLHFMPLPSTNETNALDTSETQGTVLVFHDDIAVSGLLQYYIENMGYRVLAARGEEQGLQLAREHHPDLVVIDVMMPYIDGWSILLAFKQAPDLRDMEVLMLSLMEEDDSGYSLNAAAGYLLKPIDHEQLAKTLQRYAPIDSNMPFALVVEDDPDSCDLMARLLTRAGWHSVLAENGEIALQHLKKLHKQPDLIFSDLIMPEMNGFEFIRALRREPLYSMIPVVVLTGETLSPSEIAQLKESVEEVFHKDNQGREHLQENIQRAVEEALRKKQHRVST